MFIRILLSMITVLIGALLVHTLVILFTPFTIKETAAEYYTRSQPAEKIFNLDDMPQYGFSDPFLHRYGCVIDKETTTLSMTIPKTILPWSGSFYTPDGIVLTSFNSYAASEGDFKILLLSPKTYASYSSGLIGLPPHHLLIETDPEGGLLIIRAGVLDKSFAKQAQDFAKALSCKKETLALSNAPLFQPKQEPEIDDTKPLHKVPAPVGR